MEKTTLKTTAYTALWQSFASLVPGTAETPGAPAPARTLQYTHLQLGLSVHNDTSHAMHVARHTSDAIRLMIQLTAASLLTVSP